MNIQVNLLPEAKLSRVRNQSKKRRYTTMAIVVLVAVAIAAILLAMLRVFLSGTYANGERRISDLKSEISKSAGLEESATTLQQNLASFYQLNAKRSYASRIIANFFKAVPSNVTISSFSVDDKGKVTISGTTDTFADVSKFVSSIEKYNVDYLPQADLDRKAVFTDVVITSISKNEGSTNFSISFTVHEDVLKNQRSQ